MQNDFDRLSLNETPDAVIIITSEGEVVYWNKGAETVFGYGSAEAVGRSLDEIVVPPDRLHEEHEILQKTLEADLHGTLSRARVQLDVRVTFGSCRRQCSPRVAPRSVAAENRAKRRACSHRRLIRNVAQGLDQL